MQPLPCTLTTSSGASATSFGCAGTTWTRNLGCLDKTWESPYHCVSSDPQFLVVPGKEDPPELEFYRIRPFAVSGSDRFMAHVLHYAPSPAILKAITNGTYGLTPSMCYKKNRSDCHGPHLCAPSLLVT